MDETVRGDEAGEVPGSCGDPDPGPEAISREAITPEGRNLDLPDSAPAGVADDLEMDPAEELDYLRHEVGRLRHLLAGRFREAAEAQLLGAGPGPDGKFVFDIQSSIIPLIAEHLAASFRASGAVNYVQWEVGHPELGGLVLTMQRKSGKLPASVAAEQRERADRAEAELADLRAMLAKEFGQSLSG